MPERELEVAKKEASTWETKYRQAEEARLAAEQRAKNAESAATATADTVTKEQSLNEDLLKKEIVKYANLEKFANASSVVALSKFFFSSCRVPERVESPRVCSDLLFLCL